MKHNLTNEEIVMIYERFQNHLDSMNEQFDKNRILRTVKINNEGTAVAAVVIEPETVEKLKNSNYYILTESITNKLAPIVELIKDSTDINVKHISEEL
jgi:hypothetical protein